VTFKFQDVKTLAKEIFVSDMGRIGVSVQAFKELEKKYTEN
jgi:hypothetical protein